MKDELFYMVYGEKEGEAYRFIIAPKGGEIILNVCNSILKEDYPELAEKCRVMLPDEKTRRVGQSAAAASLPEIKKG